MKTLKKPETAETLVLETLEKLKAIKTDLSCTDLNWQSWGLKKLLEALRDYTLRNSKKDDIWGGGVGKASNLIKEKSITGQSRKCQPRVDTVSQVSIEEASVVKCRKFVKYENF